MGFVAHQYTSVSGDIDLDTRGVAGMSYVRYHPHKVHDSPEART
jgi:hypothetical protein